MYPSCFGLFRLSNKEADLAGRPVSFLSITHNLYSTFVSNSYSNWLLHGFVLFVKSKCLKKNLIFFKLIILIFFYCYDVLISKINFKIINFNIFLNKNIISYNKITLLACYYHEVSNALMKKLIKFIF
jgi:hypothetical protein